MMSLRRCCCDGSELPERARRKPDCVSSGIKERLPLARPSSDRMILRRSPHFPRVCGWGDTTLVRCRLGHRRRAPGEATKLLRADVPGIHVLSMLPGGGRTWMAGTKPGHDGVGEPGYL